MGRETKDHKRRSFAGSVGSGVQSLVSGATKPYYILEHKIGSKYHRAGERQEIIVDRVEIGRDPVCQVRYDDVFETVSRRHAAITREDNLLKLNPLSKTNPTLLNGKKVQEACVLQHGDEIQCAVNGPKLVLNIPTGQNAMSSNISLHRRFFLFRKQALRPYIKMIIWLIVSLLLLAGGIFLIFM